MDFRVVPFQEYKEWGARADWNAGSDDDDEEALSFCDLPLYDENARTDGTFRDSKAGSSDPQDFDFDFDFGRSSSMAYSVCPADDLFHQGRLLPVSLLGSRSSDCDAEFAYSKSNSRSENRLLLNEKLQSWRTDSMDSQSSYWTSSSSGNSQSSHRNSNYCGSEKSFRRGNAAAAASRKCKSAKPPPSPNKTALKWQQFFTLGLMKTPSMKLEDMRLRQQKPVEKPALKRSVSCSYDEGPKQLHAALNFRQKCRSVRESMSVEETPKSRGWSMLAPLTSLNGCKASTTSVINCSTAKKRVDGAVPFAAPRKLSSKKPPFYEDQNSPSSARGCSKLAASNTSGDTRAILNSTALRSSKVDPRKLSFS